MRKRKTPDLANAEQEILECIEFVSTPFPPQAEGSSLLPDYPGSRISHLFPVFALLLVCTFARHWIQFVGN